MTSVCSRMEGLSGRISDEMKLSEAAPNAAYRSKT